MRKEYSLDRKKIGKYGEDRAGELLESKGYRIIARNWRCRCGELDLVARRGYEIVFCEVKTRTSMKYGTPAEAVTSAKKHHIRQAAMCYMKKYGLERLSWRCDVIEIYINHIENAF